MTRGSSASFEILRGQCVLVVLPTVHSCALGCNIPIQWQRSQDTVPFPERQVLSSIVGLLQWRSSQVALLIVPCALAGALGLVPCPLAGCKTLCIESEATEVHFHSRGNAAGFFLRLHVPERITAPLIWARWDLCAD